MRLQKHTWKHLSPRLDLSVAGKYLCVAILTPFACKACPPSCPQKLRRSLFFTKGKHLNLIRFFHIKHKELCLGSLSISNVLFSCSALCQGSAYIWMHCPFHFLFPASYNLTSAIVFSSGGHLYSPNCWLLQYRYRYWPLNCFNTYFNVLFLNLSLHLRSLTSIFYQFSFKLSAAKPVSSTFFFLFNWSQEFVYLFTYFIVLIVDLQCSVVSGI